MRPTHALVAPFTAVLALLILAPAQATGQGSDVDVLEIARQIRRNMITVEEGLHELEGGAAGEAARQAARDIDRLIDGKGKDGSSSGLRDNLRKRGNQVVEDIGKIIKSMKPTGKGSGQGQQKQSGKQGRPQSRDRNRSQQQGKDQGRNRQDSQQPRGQRENNTGDDPNDGENIESGKRPEPKRGKAQHIDLLEKWGNLPPERRQRLVDRNFQDFTPEYEREIRAYFKKILKR